MPRQPVTPGTQQSLKANTRPDSTTAEKYIALLERDCSDALRAMVAAQGFLYRGLRDKRTPTGNVPSPSAFRGAPHAARKAKDTYPALQVDVDNLLKASGFKALRSNSIFVTSDPDQASEYGQLYLVFPVNGFDMLWSPKYEDFYTGFLDRYGPVVTAMKHSKYIDEEDFIDVLRHGNQLIRTIRTFVSDAINDDPRHKPANPQARNFCADIYNVLTQDNFYRPILSGHPPDRELVKMLFDAWEGLEKTDPKLAQWLEGRDPTEPPAPGFEDRFATLAHMIAVLSKNHEVDQEIAQRFVRETHKFKDDGLAEAIESQNEICIAGEYYAFKLNDYGDMLSKHFGIDISDAKRFMKY